MVRTSKWSIEDFLSQYNSYRTITCYRTALRQFFSLVYPELKNNKDRQLLNELSLRYFEEERDIRKDIIRFKNSLIHKAPKTRISKFSPIFRFFEDNGIVFSKSFIRNINGKGKEAITVEHVPTSEEINRILQYLPIQAKTLTLVLTSSGMRLGEAVRSTMHDLDLNRNPARIHIPAKITKSKRKRLTFISSEDKNQLEEWLAFRDKFIKQANGDAHQRDCAREAIIFESKSIHVKNIYSNIKNTLIIYARAGGYGGKVGCHIVRVVEVRSKKTPRSAPTAGGLSECQIWFIGDRGLLCGTSVASSPSYSAGC